MYPDASIAEWFGADRLCRQHMPRPWYERRRTPVLEEGTQRRVKRALDLILCVLSLPVVIPILAACALIIRLDSAGAAVFAQVRTGKGGRPFRFYKLRTMVENAEALKADLQHLNELTYPDFKIRNDPRITRVGRWLRRTSLDELPQVLNVLLGDMTLVGPRPTSFSAKTYRLWHTARLELVPGLTGLWQVSGRNELDFDDRLRLDIAYARNQCLWLDLRILWRTIGCVCSRRGAN
jgi:lipopolysaccharide/colanic/teichoic acid biosynthesis glycosyltransferase